MATNPTERVRRRRLPTAFRMEPDDLLERLVGLEPSVDVPYLTVMVDWTVEGTSPGRAEPEEVARSQDRSGQEEGIRWRPAVEILERTIEDVIDEHGPRGDAYESLREDYDKIRNYLENDLDPSAQGAVFVTCAAKGVFEASGLAIPVQTEVKYGPTPALYQLMRLVEDNPTYAVLLADQREATLSFISYGQAGRAVTLEGSDWPRHQGTGGWSQRRLQARAGERIEAFASDIAEEARTSLDRLGVDSLIVAGDDVITSALDNEFHESVRDRIVETIQLDIRAGQDDVIEATQSIAQRAEREREADAARRLQEMIGTDTRGAGGSTDTLRALQAGQVDELLMADTFEGRGWADYGMHVFGVGNMPTEHPVGGEVSSLVEVDLREEMVRLALMTHADVEIIHSDVPVSEEQPVPDAGEGPPRTSASKAVDEYGGVGAILRYSIDETPPDEGA